MDLSQLAELMRTTRAHHMRLRQMGLLPDLAVPEARAQTIGEAESAYDLLRSVYSNPALPRGMRSRAAIEALPFEKPKLAVTAAVNGGNFGEAMERALKRSGKGDRTSAAEDQRTPSIPGRPRA
jgi:hypothetical protein